jgi:hypothetical protein
MPAPAVSAALRARRLAVAAAMRKRRARRAGEAEAKRRSTRRTVRIAGYGMAVLVLAILLPITAIIVAVAGGPDPRTRQGGGISAAALADIPPEALTAYRDAAATWSIDWAILAAIGKAECDHGRVQLDGCNPPGTVNYAGARGYMQFIGTTWRKSLGTRELEPRSSPPAPDGQGFATDGDGDGDADPWSWADASQSAARYLYGLNVNADAAQAVYGYNHSPAYVEEVLSTAASYRAAEVAGPGSYEGVAGNVPLVRVEGITVHEQIADQVGALVRAARADGLDLGGSGYRDPRKQIELRRAHCGASEYAIYEMPSSQCSPPTARPGKSNHEKGLAIDFTCNGGSIGSHANPCYSWLAANAAAFGLRNLPSEPWHWSVDGT